MHVAQYWFLNGKNSIKSIMKYINISHSIELLMSILVTSPCPENTVKKLGIKSWPICIPQESSFDYNNIDKETYLLIVVK